MTTAALWVQARKHLDEGNAEAARSALAQLLEREPGHANAHLLLSAIAHTQGRLRLSARHAVEACGQAFSDATVLCNAIAALLRTGEVAQAQRCLQDPLVASCAHGPTLVRLANAQQSLGNHADALALLDRALATGMDNPDVRYLRSVQLTFNGRTQDAIAELETCLRMGTTYGRAAVTLARLARQTPEHNHLGFIRERLRHVPAGSEDAAAFEFAQYKELEDLGDHAAAWNALARGNAIMSARLGHDPVRESALVDGLIALTDKPVVEGAPIQLAGPQPIFIIGMPRSGTTLLDRILGNHSQVTPAGELGDFMRQVRWAMDHVTNQPLDDVILAGLDTLDLAEVGRRYLQMTQWRAPATRYFTDKLPANYLLAGLIMQALPNARILHLVRDPMDVCFSNYRAYFGGGYAYSYSLDALARQYQDYRRLMRHWHAVAPGRILDVSYARLTRDSEAMIDEVFAFCGLPGEPGCLDLARNRAPVATLSAMQVRDGIRQTSFEEWRRYETQLAPLRALIGDAP
jgi:tetratricopeptide (TPR) repeat protein